MNIGQAETILLSISEDEHRRFATLSGDLNPMHLDEKAARRTNAGTRAVHGMHTCLKSLEELVRRLPASLHIHAVKARFRSFLGVQESAQLTLTLRTASLADLRVTRGSAIIAGFSVTVSELKVPLLDDQLASSDEWRMDRPCVLTLADLEGRRGTIPIDAQARSLASAFPLLTEQWGAPRVAAAATMSTLVGMICPGLHSILASVDLQCSDQPDPSLAYSVTEIDERFGRLRQSAHGSGVAANCEAFMRPAPVVQPLFSEVQSRVSPNEFTKSVALVIGASRGLGELVAKAIAAGGGKVFATYHVGVDECRQIADEAAAAGGQITCLRFDSRQEVSDQLSKLSEIPRTIYYFATPQIFSRQDETLDSARLEEFMNVYVHGFYRLWKFFAQHAPARVMFYPSSIAVESRPKGMTAYSMAKAAAEILCDDLQRQHPALQITVKRLPRLLTDQTATVAVSETQDGLGEFCPSFGR